MERPDRLGSNAITGVSCPSVSFCFAVDIAGTVYLSTNPTAASPRWNPDAGVDPGPGEPYGISCTPDELCVAVDNAGFAMTNGGRPGR